MGVVVVTGKARGTTFIRVTMAALVLASASAMLAPNPRAQSEIDCDASLGDGSYWRGCRFTPDTDRVYCGSCSAYSPWTAPRQREYSIDLTDHDVLLLLAHGLSDRLSGEINASLWQQQSFTRSHQLPAAQHPFMLRWAGHRFEEHHPHFDLSSYLTTVVSPRSPVGSPRCQDCEFALALGLVWGYRWATVSGRFSAHRGTDSLTLTPDYGFQMLHRASPKWRYVLAIARDSESLDLVGETHWLIRPDAYLVLTSGMREVASLSPWKSDLQLRFSFE